MHLVILDYVKHLSVNWVKIWVKKKLVSCSMLENSSKLKSKRDWKQTVKQSFNRSMNHINGCLSCQIFIRALRRLNKVSRQLRHLQYRLPKVFWGSA